MEQNINLLQNLELQKTSKYLSKTFLMLIISVFFAILLIAYAINLRLYNNLQKNLDLINQQQLASNLQLETIKKEIATVDKLIATTSIMTSELITKPFTLYLEQLATYTPPRIWLEKISLDNENQVFIIEGKTLQPLLITEYIKVINKKQIFTKNTMSSLKLQKDFKGPATTFTLSNLKEQQ